MIDERSGDVGCQPEVGCQFTYLGRAWSCERGQGKEVSRSWYSHDVCGRYPENRESDSVRMWNPETNGVVTTRDVIWMNKMFFEKPSEDENEDELMVHLTEAVYETVEVVKSDDESEAGESVNG